DIRYRFSGDPLDPIHSVMGASSKSEQVLLFFNEIKVKLWCDRHLISVFLVWNYEPGCYVRSRMWCLESRLREGNESAPGLVKGPGRERDEGEGNTAAWVRQKLGFEPDAMQERVLATHKKRGLLNCTRQWGKSTLTAAKAVHQAYTERESLTLVVSPSA